MSRYLDAVNEVLVREAGRHPGLLQFGENIRQGSRVCGLARNLAGHLLTVGNCENTHVGVGLGMMIEGGEALLVVKQLDFLLLAVDQMVNTMNLVRASGRDTSTLGSFTILAIVCDQGWQGPQSSFHDLAGLCSLARVDGFHINGAGDAERILSRHLVRPGFRLIAVSQRRFGEQCLELPVMGGAEGDAELQYLEGRDATVAAFGFALPHAVAEVERLRRQGLHPALFGLNPVWPHGWRLTAASAARSGRLVVLDDARGAVSQAHKLASQVLRAAPGCHVTIHAREHEGECALHGDRFEVAA